MHQSNDEHLGDLALIVGIAFAIIAPLSWIYEKLMREYVKNIIKFRMFDDLDTLQQTPPLDHLQAEIFKTGLKKYVRDGKILEASITEEKAK